MGVWHGEQEKGGGGGGQPRMNAIPIGCGGSKKQSRCPNAAICEACVFFSLWEGLNAKGG
jgi:hypothetical protein